MTPIRLRAALPLLLLVGAAAPAQADVVESVQFDVDVTCPYGCIELDNGQIFVRMSPAEAEQQYGGEDRNFCVEIENNVFTILNTLSYYGPLGILDAVTGGISIDIKCLDAGYMRDPQFGVIDPTVWFLAHHNETSE